MIGIDLRVVAGTLAAQMVPGSGRSAVVVTAFADSEAGRNQQQERSNADTQDPRYVAVGPLQVRVLARGVSQRAVGGGAAGADSCHRPS